MDITALITAFAFIFIAEFGDKTQLTAVVLSSKGSSISVFTGAMAAFFLVDGVSALLGGQLLGFLPYRLVALGSGLVFVGFGVFSLFRGDGEFEVESSRATFLKTFSLIALMELGDKTQLASIVLAAEFQNPVIVVVGVMFALSAVTLIGVALGTKLLRLIPKRYLRIGTSLLFILFGAIFILDALTG
jgi:putative Ca2+/H+ antiporter (TMEM165/GDT1 family)